uniref:Saccharopine dehydrogenase NADP binding domain-containing protein n=1 Tax=Timema tahoe TaxID=61484 RepID=A0A7R9IFA1_9NEOP|nr:unnamed protein product [Timema tahoe]
MVSEESKLDMVVFGATGFTGRYTVMEMVALTKEKGDLKWGVAGRNKAKLDELISQISLKTGEDLGKVSVIVADVNDESSLLKMAAQTRLVINTVGPYRFYGEAVVKACVASGAHHVDVSGEPQYMERMQLEYHEEAKQKGVYVVSACGFDSVPADLGTIFLVDKFKGDVNSVETYLQSWNKSEHKGPSIHYGTWESAVYGLAHAGELRPLREKLYPKRLPQMLPKLKPSYVDTTMPDTVNIYTSYVDTTMPDTVNIYTSYVDTTMPDTVNIYTSYVDTTMPDTVNIYTSYVDTTMPDTVNIYTSYVDTTMPDTVLPHKHPWAAFAKTTLVEELDKHGLKFEVVSEAEK